MVKGNGQRRDEHMEESRMETYSKKIWRQRIWRDGDLESQFMETYNREGGRYRVWRHEDIV